MSLGHFEKETVTHKNENTLQVYRHKFVHFFFNAKTLSSNTICNKLNSKHATLMQSSIAYYFLNNIKYNFFYAFVVVKTIFTGGGGDTKYVLVKGFG